jgi:TPR repeat protein
LLRACRQNHAAGQFQLGELYFEGRGIDKDIVEAFTWWKKAGEAGHAGAQYRLGLMYENGTGVGKDLTKALEWYKLASSNGDSQAATRHNLVASIVASQGKAPRRSCADSTIESEKHSTPWYLNADRNDY